MRGEKLGNTVSFSTKKKEQEQSLETICLQPHNVTVMSGFQGHDNEQLQQCYITLWAFLFLL